MKTYIRRQLWRLAVVAGLLGPGVTLAQSLTGTLNCSV